MTADDAVELGHLLDELNTRLEALRAEAHFHWTAEGLWKIHLGPHGQPFDFAAWQADMSGYPSLIEAVRATLGDENL